MGMDINATNTPICTYCLCSCNKELFVQSCSAGPLYRPSKSDFSALSQISGKIPIKFLQ